MITVLIGVDGIPAVLVDPPGHLSYKARLVGAKEKGGQRICVIGHLTQVTLWA